MNEDSPKGITRRDFIKTSTAGTLAMGVCPTILIPGRAKAAGKTLKILQWSHFVPRYDKEWFDSFTKKWGEANGVEVTVDHINLIEIWARTSAEISSGDGHDLIEWIAPPAQFEPNVADMTDVNQEAQKRFGKQHPLCVKSSYNPNTKKYYSFCHGWVIDPGCYRKSMWTMAGKPTGPEVWEDLITLGGAIKKEQGVQIGIGLSQELDSNMASRTLLWSFDSSVQDENENVVLNNPKTVEAVAFMAKLYKEAMTPEVFSWVPVSNNQALIAGKVSYILNSISAYRSAQKAVPEIAKDVFFVPPLKGPRSTQWACEHLVYNYIIPSCSKQPDLAKQFLLSFIESYDQAMYNSELYNSPAFFDAPLLAGDRGYKTVANAKTIRDLHNAWFDDDPFRLPDEEKGKLSVLKSAETWSTNVGHPGPANPAIGEVFSTCVLPNMMASADRGTAPEQAVAEAEALVKAIFKKWRKKGLVGGTE